MHRREVGLPLNCITTTSIVMLLHWDPKLSARTRPLGSCGRSKGWEPIEPQGQEARQRRLFSWTPSAKISWLRGSTVQPHPQLNTQAADKTKKLEPGWVARNLARGPAARNHGGGLWASKDWKYRRWQWHRVINQAS